MLLYFFIVFCFTSDYTIIAFRVHIARLPIVNTLAIGSGYDDEFRITNEALPLDWALTSVTKERHPYGESNWFFQNEWYDQKSDATNLSFYWWYDQKQVHFFFFFFPAKKWCQNVAGTTCSAACTSSLPSRWSCRWESNILQRSRRESWKTVIQQFIYMFGWRKMNMFFTIYWSIW